MNLFWNKQERRLRAGWRLLLAGVLLSVLLPLFNALLPAAVAFAAYLRGDVPPAPSIQDLTNLVNQVINHSAALVALQRALGVLGAVVVVWLAARLLDRRPFRAFGFHFNRRWWVDFGFGLALGALLMAFIFLAERAAGWVTVAGMRRYSYPVFWVPMLTGVLLFIGVGIEEELLTRAYLLINLSEGNNSRRLGPRGALLLAYISSSAVFGLLHLGNPNATWMSTFNIMTAGIFLGLGFVLTGELAIPIGVHISWNYFQGYVFGFPVSGMPTAEALFDIQQGGPLLWTGGAFGPEAGLIGLAAILLGCLLTFLWVRWRHGSAELHTSLSVYKQAPAASSEAEPAT